MNNWNDGSEKYNIEHKLRVAEQEIERLRAELKEIRAVNDRHVDRLNSLLRERDAAIKRAEQAEISARDSQRLINELNQDLGAAIQERDRLRELLNLMRASR